MKNQEVGGRKTCVRDGEDLSDGRENMQAWGSGRVTISAAFVSFGGGLDRESRVKCRKRIISP